MDALEFVGKESKSRRQQIYVLTGDEDFLKRRVLEKLLPQLLGESDPEFAVANYPGDKAEFSTIRNELETLPFLSERRIVIVDLGGLDDHAQLASRLHREALLDALL